MKISQPIGYLIRMIIFLSIILLVLLVLSPTLIVFFNANPFLNGLIVVVFIAGVFVAFRQVLKLRPEVKWVNLYRKNIENVLTAAPPVLLAPVAAVLAERSGRISLSASSLRSILDSIGARIEESRDLNRYLVGLLVFLGLLGTFWGLLQTVQAISGTIKTLDIAGGDANTLFEKLRAGLEQPLDGMGLAFSSSLLGLGFSLILGYLDLKANNAQSRFYNELEDWLILSMNVTTDEESSARQIAQLTNEVSRLIAMQSGGTSGGGGGGGGASGAPPPPPSSTPGAPPPPPSRPTKNLP